MLRRILRFIGLPGALAAALSLVLAGVNFAELAHDRAQEAQAALFLRSELAKLGADGAAEAHRDQIMELLARSQIAGVLEDGRQHGLRLLNEVADRQAPGVRLTHLSLQGRRAELRGVATTDKAVQGFISSLAASPYMGAPEHVTTRTVAGQVEFGLVAGLR